VADGSVTLEGAVPFQCQRAAAESAIRRLSGIKAICNLIRIEPTEVERAGWSALEVRSVDDDLKVRV
jgi:hypothetical protein